MSVKKLLAKGTAKTMDAYVKNKVSGTENLKEAKQLTEAIQDDFSEINSPEFQLGYVASQLQRLLPDIVFQLRGSKTENTNDPLNAIIEQECNYLLSEYENAPNTDKEMVQSFTTIILAMLKVQKLRMQNKGKFMEEVLNNSSFIPKESGIEYSNFIVKSEDILHYYKNILTEMQK